MATPTKKKKTDTSMLLEISDGEVVGGGTLAKPEEAGQIIGQAADLSGFLDEGYSLEKIVKLERPGAYVKGSYEGTGGSVDVRNPTTGEISAIGTIRLRVLPTVVVVLLETAQLKARFAAIPIGESVVVQYLGKIESGSRRVNDYHVLRKSRPIDAE
jgi:hypothetical protein